MSSAPEVVAMGASEIAARGFDALCRLRQSGYVAERHPDDVLAVRGWIQDLLARLSSCEARSSQYLQQAFENGQAANTLAARVAELELEAERLREDAEVQWEVWQDEMMVAASSDESDARHYLMVYSQDGPAELMKSLTVRLVADTKPAEGEV